MEAFSGGEARFGGIRKVCRLQASCGKSMVRVYGLGTVWVKEIGW